MRQPDTPLRTRLLQSLDPWRQASTWRIAFSGGLDSTVLLHLLSQIAKTEALPNLRALHVHHGLQVAADGWPAHCQSVCESLGIPLEVIGVDVRSGASIEQAARDARYQVFAEATGENDVLLTAQHRDDQAETLLFRLMRGAGVRGLASIPREREVGLGHMVRPFLEVSRAELHRYACEHQLEWIDDPSNTDRRFSRNYLRHEIFPALIERWPQATATMARSAAHLSEAQGLLDELAEIDLAGARCCSDFAWLGLPSLALAHIARLSHARQRNALRTWLASLTRLPDMDHWAGWESLRDAGPEACPVWRLADGELHRADGHVWWLSDDWLRQPEAGLEWSDPHLPLVLPGNGELLISGTVPSGPLQVSYRLGGEVLHLPNRGHRDLKRLLNERGVPAFVRGRLPLVYQNEQLLAVANLPGLNADACAGWYLQWRPSNRDLGLS